METETGYAKLNGNQLERPPLSEVRKTLQIKWYRCSMEPKKFGEFMKRSDLQGLFQAGGHLCIFCCTGMLVLLFWSKHMWLAMVAALFLHGTVSSCLLFATHELGHGTVFRTSWLNKFFLYAFSLISWWDPFDYALSHTYHHRYTQHPEADRENLLPYPPSLEPLLMLQLFTVDMFSRPGRIFGKGGLLSTIVLTIKVACCLPRGPPETPIFEWMESLYTDQPEEAKKAMWWCQVLLLFHCGVLVISIMSGIWALPLVITIPCFIGKWYSYFMGHTQHCVLPQSVPDFRISTRSLTLDPISEFLYWHMNWHIEHHMFAAVPCYNLKQVHDEVAHDMPKPRTLWGAWKEMRDIWHQQQLDPNYEFYVPLPKTGKDDEKINDTENLEGSIGDLAPSSLK